MKYYPQALISLRFMIDFKRLFQNDIPLIDVRAPVEFSAGHFPRSINLPILSDQERHLIGTRYKEKGQESAIQLGHELVTGAVKEARVDAWKRAIAQNPTAVLYCFRGGLRSRITQQWLSQAGVTIELVPGGYKALRHFLMDVIECESAKKKFILLSGRTGSAKTRVLYDAAFPFIDLEKCANHKGSSFGSLGAQPAQITFENRVAIELLKLESAPRILLEDESVMIGALTNPRRFFDQMLVSPVIVLEREFEERVHHIIDEYVIEKTKYFLGDEQQTRFFMLESLGKIQKKLGALNYSKIQNEIIAAIESTSKNAHEVHSEWVGSLLTHYYDPLYDRALKRKAERVIFRGNEKACIDFLKDFSGVQ